MPKAKINGIQLYYETHGAGFPLLLIAGLGCDSQVWLPSVQVLSDSFQLIVFDNRGVGRSDTPDILYGISPMADDARQLLDHLGIQSAHVIGHSMGGYIAQELAINYPERVNKLILVSTAPVSSTRNNILFSNFLKWLQDGMELEAWLWAWLFWLIAPQRFADREFINAYIQDALVYPYPQSVVGFKGQIEAISTYDARDRLERIRAETLVIEGEEDILILPREAEVLLRGIHKSSMLLVPDAAHRIQMERPDVFNQAVLEFLSGPGWRVGE